MGKEDLEKGNTLPDLSGVYGGIEDNKQVGGVAEEVSQPTSDEPKPAGSSGGSWFTKKRIIIIAVVTVLVVAGAVGGAVGGVLGSKGSGDDNDNSSDSQSSGDSTGGPASTASSPATGTASGDSNPTPTIANPDPTALGAIMPTGFTAVAFNDFSAPSSIPSASVLTLNQGFPGISAPLSSDSIIVNGDFDQALTGWQNPGGCWDIADWDGEYNATWNGEAAGADGCTLSQVTTRKDESKEEQFMCTFLFRNSDAADDTSQLWAFLGDEDTMYTVLSTKAGKPTSDDNWDKFATAFNVKAGKSPIVWFRSVHEGEGYWQVSMVECVPRP